MVVEDSLIERSRSRRWLISGILQQSLSAMPIFLLGALAVQVRDDFNLTPSALGLLASAFYMTAALGSVHAGRITGRIGPGRAMYLVSLGSVSALVGVAVLARSWWHLLACLAVAGIATSFSQPASNLALARHGQELNPGLAFGLLQSAIPLSSLLAGLAVPLVALTLGWRWAYALAAIMGLLLLAILPSGGRRPIAAVVHRPVGLHRAPLAVLAMGAGFGSGAATSMTIFYVDLAVAHGQDVAVAGIWLAIGSLSSIATRIALGWWVGRRAAAPLPWVACLLVAGASALIGLSLSRPPALGLFTVLAFGAGWGWNGLFHFAVVRHSPGEVASATGITTAGMRAGSVVGPLLVGLVHQFGSYQSVWLSIAGALLMGALLILFGHHLMQRMKEVQG